MADGGGGIDPELAIGADGSSWPFKITKSLLLLAAEPLTVVDIFYVCAMPSAILAHAETRARNTDHLKNGYHG